MPANRGALIDPARLGLDIRLRWALIGTAAVMALMIGYLLLFERGAEIWPTVCLKLLLLCASSLLICFAASQAARPRDRGRTQEVVTHQMVDELKQQLLELEQAKQLSDSTSQRQSDFLANISHEIRTPLNGLLGMTGLLLETPLNAEQRDLAETVRSSGAAMLNIVNDVLDFSKIEAGRLDLTLVDFDLRTTLDDVLHLLAAKAHDKGLELGAIVHPEVPSYVSGDPGRLRQILVNLIGNAVKFTEQGEVTLLAAVDREQEAQTWLRLEVQDTGIGIPQDKLERLFERFYQVDGATNRQQAGTGLGLAFSKKLIELMDGEIGVQSEPGRGSNFWFTVRLTRRAAPEPLTGKTARDLKGLRALCCGDSRTGRRVLESQLAALGLAVDFASGGSEALGKLQVAAGQGRPYAVTIVDCHIGVDVSLDLPRAISREEGLRSTPVVLLTSIARAGDGVQARSAGVAGYLPKPVRLLQLEQCLKVVLSDSGTESSPQPLVTRHVLAEAEAQSRARVLVVEDNRVNQKVVVKLLERLSCRVDVASSGPEALKALEDTPYDLILMDCQMPGMDGYETTREIRKRESSGRRTPILAVTALAMQSDRVRCIEAGMDDHIAKPISLDALRRALERWLGNPKDAASSEMAPAR